MMLKMIVKLLFLKTLIKRFWWVPLVYVVLTRVLPWERETGPAFD